MSFDHENFQRKVSKIFIHLKRIGNQQVDSEKSSLASSSEIKLFGHYTENKMKRPSVGERCIRRLSVPFKQMTQENTKMRQLVQRGFLLIMSICQLKYADTLQMESWYFLNGSVLHCSLYICIHKIGATFSETNIFILLRQIYYALEYIHQNGLIHGNITSHAIRIMDTYTVKLSSFEYMHVKETERKWPTGDSWRWMSPETLLKKQSGLKSDIFSFCCLCLECFSNCLPWEKRSELFVKEYYTNGNIFPQDNFSVSTEIKECFSDGLVTKKHKRKLNFYHFETVMKSRVNRALEYNLNNAQINLRSPNVSESRCSNQIKKLSQQQLNLKTSSKNIHTNVFAVLKNKKSNKGNASNSSNKMDFNRIRTTDSVKFLIEYFEDRSTPNNSRGFNLKNLRRRTVSPSNRSATINSPETVQISRALLFMKSPDIRNRISQKTPLQKIASLEKLQTPKNDSPGIVNTQISNSSIENRTKRINNLVYLRRQTSGFQKLSFKNSSPEKSPLLEHFATASTEHFDVDRDFIEKKTSVASSARRKSFPLYSSASKTHYWRPNQDNRNSNIKFSHSSDKTSSEQKPETSKIQKTQTNQKSCTFKDYVKTQVNRWENPNNEHIIKSQRIHFKSDYKYSKYMEDKDIHSKINI